MMTDSELREFIKTCPESEAARSYRLGVRDQLLRENPKVNEALRRLEGCTRADHLVDYNPVSDDE